MEPTRVTATEFKERTEARISVLHALEYRVRRANQLGIRLRGFVLTEAEAEAITTGPGMRCWIDGRLMPVAKVIPTRTA
jgi:hypothetical protein